MTFGNKSSTSTQQDLWMPFLAATRQTVEIDSENRKTHWLGLDIRVLLAEDHLDMARRRHEGCTQTQQILEYASSSDAIYALLTWSLYHNVIEWQSQPDTT